MLAFDLLHRQLPHRVLLRRKMSSIDTRLVCVIPGDAKRREQGAEFQEHRILAGTHHISQDSPCVMIDRMPEPSLSSFGPHETPHFIHFSGAPWSDANGVGAWPRKS